MERIGPYRVADGPFKGGFGEVYRVIDTSSGDEFALKSLQGSFLPSSDRLFRFREEIKAWIDIPVHPNVVRAIKAFDHGGRPYVVIEWISSGDLRLALPQLRSSAQALVIMRQVCEGMSHIHQQGLVHGDLKPSNVMMWAGESPQITDFGFARAAGTTDLRWVGGTERYLAPEALLGVSDLSIDVYAAGVTFLELLERFGQDEFGVSEARQLALDMTREDPATRPATFSVVLERLAEILAAASIVPTVPTRPGSRQTWEEEHVHPIGRFGLMSEARTLVAAGRRLEARARLHQIIAEHPTARDARMLLAHCLIEDGDSKAALEHLRAARSLANEEPEELLSIGLMLTQVGQLDEARQIAETVSEGPQRWYLCASVAKKSGSLSEAMELYQKALDAGGDYEVRLGFASALKDAGLPDAAISELMTIGREHPDAGVRVVFQLARIYVDLGRYDDAVRELQVVLRTDHGPRIRSYTYTELGYIYRQQELYDAAIASYAKALAIEPQDREAQEGLALSREAQTNPASRHAPDAVRRFGVETSLDAYVAYTTLAELEKRFEHDRLEDIIPNLHRVGWALLTNEVIIPRLLETGRISSDESTLLDRIRRRECPEPKDDEDGITVFPDVYELLLTLRTAFEMSDEAAFRGHRHYRWNLVPSVCIGADTERAHRMERTCDFLRRLASLEGYRDHESTGTQDWLMGLVAVAQHCGMPTTVLEFSSDVRVAASLATIDGSAAEVGEIVVLRPAQLEPLAAVAGNPYGRFVHPAPTPGIERQKSLFLDGTTPSVLLDPDTTCVERYRFRHDGRPFPAAGGYGSEDLLKDRRDLAARVKHTAVDPAVAARLDNALKSYSICVRQMSCNRETRATEGEYGRACATWLASLLADGSPPINRTVAAIFTRMQGDLRKKGKQKDYVTHVSRAMRAFESYLDATGTLDERFAAGLRAGWLGRSPEGDELVLSLADRYIEEYFDVR